jgi:hypothetical protein
MNDLMNYIKLKISINMKGIFMEKINQIQAIAEIMEIGTASEITLGSTGNTYENIQGDLQYILSGKH